MVRVQPGRDRGGRAGKLSSDPAVTTAAVALSLGYADPLSLLALDRHDFNVMVAAIEVARTMQDDYDTALAKYNAALTANYLAPIIVKALNQIAAAMR